MKKIIFVLAITLFFHPSSAQTYVNGGIYSNTTWTLANSPYIVTGSVIVFQGVTLTVEPGVIVKFDDNHGMEVRGYLNAVGAANDTIVFTSSSGNPFKGIWNNITIKSDSIYFDFIKIEYAYDGIVNQVYNNHG